MAQTTRDSEVDVGQAGRPVAGVVVVWSCETPRLLTLRVPPPGLVLGRESLAQTGDDRLSRQHARIRWNGTRFQVADLGSRNGTFVGGSLVADGEVTALPPVVVRTGRTVSLLVPDIQPFEDAEVATVDGAIVGPTLRHAWDAVERAARGGKTLLLTGESGAGKELAARAFHRASGATGELVAVNCAAIPAGVAERLLFGAKKGAYSGADKDADGYLVTADHGTLFLDEIAELDAQVQAKLLRVLETGEVMPLGAARPRPIELRIVAATLRDLRGEVQAGKFRDDLYFRIGRPEVRLPALRERLEDIAWLVAEAARSSALPPHPSLVEACLLRPWPGNVRELMGEVGRAAHAATEAARKVVRSEDLDGSAGRLLVPGEMATLPPGSVRPKPATLPDHGVILAALRDESGNVTRAARRLGIHRNQLRRYVAKHPDAAELSAGSPAEDDESSPGTVG
ncbi:MAG: sigma 54-interacting transcriptional regulator [Deltaproteobacteria bacterium]|nr:sigma 54-interacting transcriptional regulator [Kofleriaceae bacterium]